MTRLDLRRSIEISLKQKKRVTPAEIPPGTTDAGGWWGDELPDSPRGSKLWLLRRARRNKETRLRAIEYAQDALEWLQEYKPIEVRNAVYEGEQLIISVAVEDQEINVTAFS